MTSEEINEVAEAFSLADGFGGRVFSESNLLKFVRCIRDLPDGGQPEPEPTQPQSGTKKFAVFDPADTGMTVYDDRDQALAAAQSLVESYLDCDRQWGEGVEDIVVAEVIARATQVDRRVRPDNLDSEDCDESGLFWPENIEWMCGYEMMSPTGGNLQ